MTGRDQRPCDRGIGSRPCGQVQLRPRPCPLSVTRQVVVCPEVPCIPQSRGGILQLGRAHRQLGRRWRGVNEAFIEERTLQPQAFGRRSAGSADGDRATLPAQDRQPVRREPRREAGQRIAAGPDLPRRECRIQCRDQRHPRIGTGLDPGAAHLGRALAHQVGRRDEATARGVQGVGPAEAMVQEILQRRPSPQRSLRVTGRVGVVAHHAPVRTEHRPWQRHVDLETTGMRVGGDVARGPGPLGNSGPCHGEDQLQAQVHLPAQHRIPGIERRAIDVARREGEHEARVFPLERKDGQHRAQRIVAATKHLRPGIAQDRFAHSADLLQDDRRIHVAGQRQIAVGAAPRAIIVVMGGEGDQHSGTSGTWSSSCDAGTPVRRDASIP